MADTNFTWGTVHVSADMLPTLNTNINLNSSSDEITTVHKWNGSEWVWVQVPSRSYYFQLEDTSKIKVLVSDDSDLDRQSLASAVAKAFAGLPAEMRKPLNGGYEFEFAIMAGFGGYYTGFSGVNNIVLNDQKVWDTSYGNGQSYGYLEELVAHEVAHASLDKLIYNEPDWQTAVDDDSPFWISQYAQDYPDSEDVAETVVPLLSIILYNNPSDVDYELKTFLDDTIAGIPNRYKYISENIFNVSNYECLLEERGWVENSSSCKPEPEPELKDVNGDGFVDEVTNYQMWTESGGIDLTNRRGKTFSDDTSRLWDLTKAIEVDGGFEILLEGDRSKEGKYRLVNARDTGVISGATPWVTGRKLAKFGYEEIFDMDFNGNDVVDVV